MSDPQEPYAFYRPGERVEKLKDHIIRGLKAIENYYLAEGYQHYVASRLRALSITVRPVEIEGALILSYAYHDIAKAAEPYQSGIVRGHGAPGHEIVSAYMAHMALEEGALRLPEPLKWACVKAIAMHMGAMREMPEQSIDGALRVLSRAGCDAFTMDKGVVSWFNKLLERCWCVEELPPLRLPGPDVVVSLGNLLRFVSSSLSPRLRGSGKFSAEDLTTMLVLHPLLIADELAVVANTSREPKRWARDFVDSVEVARKYRREAHE